MLRCLALAETFLSMLRSNRRRAMDAGRPELPRAVDEDLNPAWPVHAECKPSSQDNLQQHHSREFFFGRS
jgi:hypothetical protein